MRISFDYDGCLGDNLTMQMLAKTLAHSHAEVFILTSRCKELDNRDVFDTAHRVGIKKDNIIFACDMSKADIFTKMRFDLHFDDNLTDVHIINNSGLTHKGKEIRPAMLVNYDYSQANNEMDWL